VQTSRSFVMFCCVMLCSIVFFCFCYARSLLRFFCWYLDSCVLQVSKTLSLDVVYKLGYFYVMCCEYGDINSCRH
jgi:hypothetical protein